ncbi:hypothetical protein [Natronobiforma cellulositropha]|uniref:hypothetical protein n=1 Tax=Natronobiforma cellulositropha TaxID=1679076 RepID=UPI0021D5F113|nr:hypothetical protein [Natronobiforma cellulositropha]
MIVVVPVDTRSAAHPTTLVEETDLTAADATTLARAAAVDVLRAVAASGGELLVNYREEADAGGDGEDTSAAAADAAALVEAALDSSEDVRLERQVGSGESARIGNTVTHLLEREEHASVGVLSPYAPLVSRTEIDGAAMSSRRSEVVLGPTDGGAVYLSCFTEPIDFTDAYRTPALSRVARRAHDADLGVGFAPMVPTLETEAGLCATIAGLEARRLAGRAIPEATAAAVTELGLIVEEGPAVGRN